MSRGVLVLRPEPGNAMTAARLVAMGVAIIRQPLFGITPVDWRPPDPEAFDALLMTSANAARHAGAGLAKLAHVPVLAVGEATAAAAREAGLRVVWTGEHDAAATVALGRNRGFTRLLHLAGQDRIDQPGIETVTVYRSEALPIAAGAATAWEGWVALLHSARAARHFAAVVDRDGVARRSVSIAALSPAVRDAAGPGWADMVVAEQPTDAALVARAVALIDPAERAVDKLRR